MRKILLCISLIVLCLLSACGLNTGHSIPEECQKGEHTWEGSVDQGDGTHVRKCYFCGAVDEPEAHAIDTRYEVRDQQHFRRCKSCNYVEIGKHVYSTCSLANIGTHSFVCDVCRYEGTAAHSFENNACTECGLQTQITPFAEAPGTITTEPLTVETEHFIIQIDENIYVVDGVGEKFEKIYAALETVMGITFSEQAYPLSIEGNREKITVHVTWDKSSWEDRTDPDCEDGEAFATQRLRRIQLAPLDLFIDSNYVGIHETVHCIQYYIAPWGAAHMQTEGWDEYICYKTLKYLWETDPEFGVQNAHPDQVLLNNQFDEGVLYSKTMEYWLENGFTGAHNGNYTLGFWFYYYVDETYGDCNRWLYELQALCKDKEEYNIVLPLETDIACLKNAYGEDVLDGFYPWLKNFLTEKTWNQKGGVPFDYSAIQELTVYPKFYAAGYHSYLLGSHWPLQDHLCISLGPFKDYLQRYKGKDISGLYLNELDSQTLALYDAAGKLIDVTSDTSQVPLEGVSYIKHFYAGRSILTIEGMPAVQTSSNP